MRAERVARWLAAALAIALAAPAAAQIAYRSGASASTSSGSSIAIVVPAGTSVGDVMIAGVGFRPCSSTSGRNCTKTIAADPDWTLLAAIDQRAGGGTGGYGLRLFIYYRVVDGSEAASYTWSAGGSPASTGIVGGILTFSGVDASNPIVAHAGQATANGQNHTAPSINTGTVANTMLVSTHVALSSGTWTVPAGMTERIDRASVATPNDLGISLEMNTEPRAATGNTGTRTAVLSNPPVGDTGAAHMLALRPAPNPASALGGFNAFETSTPAGSLSGVIKTKIAGAAFTLALVALNASRTALATGFTGTVTVDVLDATDNSGALNATTGCRSSWSTLQTVTPNPAFGAADNGRINVGFNVAVARRELRVRVTYISGTTTIVGCSNDAFAVRPAGFVALAATDDTDATAGTARVLNNANATSGVVHRAGRAFTVLARAVNADGATTTAGYDGGPTLAVSSCVQPAGCTAGALTASLTATNGTVAGSATYSEAGVIAVALSDSDFAAIDAADSSVAERTATSAAATFGRFVPDAYRLAVAVAPQFGAPLCGAGPATQSFVFAGQPFSFATTPRVLATPINAAGQALANARPRFGPDAVSAALTASGAPLAFSGAPSASSVTATATATIDFAPGSFSFVRGAAPVASFTPALSMTVDVADATETGTAGNGVIADEATLAIGPIAFAGGAGTVHYARLQLAPAVGDMRRDLVVPLAVLTYNGLGWVPLAAAANCVTAGATAFAYSQPTGALADGAGAFNCGTRVVSPVTTSNGRAAVPLPKPANTGTTQPAAMTMTLNVLAVAAGSSCSALGTATPATTAAMPWLANPDGTNPAARVTWNRVRGDLVQLRERFD
jgi:MSHA biogenesis protein MshQ